MPELLIQGKVYAAVPPLYKTTNGKEVKYWRPSQLSEYKKYMRNHKNAESMRFKGLGEMSAEELYSTTMDPANRELIQLTPENLQTTLALYDTLMGKSPSARKDYIIKNRLSKYDTEDTFDDYDDEE